MVNLQKIEIESLKDCSDIILGKIHSEVLENCNFLVFAIFSTGSWQPSWIAQPLKIESTPFAGHSD